MAFPTTDWPDAFDGPETRVDGFNTVYDDDFNYTDEQVRALQQFLGRTDELIGETIPGKGTGGLASSIPSGGVALTLAARDPFVAGDVLQVGDNYDIAFVPKMTLSYDGVLWALGGVDAAEALWIPFTALPPAGSEGRLRWDPAASMLKYDDGAVWNDVGGSGSGSYIDMATGYSYVQGAVPVEEVIGQGYFDGAIAGGTPVYFRAIVDTIFAGLPGPSQVKLYDMGPAAGPPAAPTLITTLTTVVPGGPTVLEQLLAVGAAPGANQIANSPRMYELTAIQTSALGDSMYIGSSGLDVR